MSKHNSINKEPSKTGFQTQSHAEISAELSQTGVQEGGQDESQPPRESEMQTEGLAYQVRKLLETEGIFESPIDLNLTRAVAVDATLLEWVNYEVPPKKMKITNSGHTVILSAKWNQERPYVIGGPLIGKYVFSQMHLHWGAHNMEGSEHTIDGGYQSGEMHVVLFKSGYLTQESALKEKDGVVVLVYLIKIQDFPNPGFQIIVDALENIEKPHSSIKLKPVELGVLFRQFNSDYFFYWGTVSTESCVHYIMWFVTRVPIGVSSDQIDSLRYLLNTEDQPIRRNFRQLQYQERTVLHVCPSPSKYSTLLPVPREEFKMNATGEIRQVYRVQILCDNSLSFAQVNNQQNSKKGCRNKKRKVITACEILTLLEEYQ